MTSSLGLKIGLVAQWTLTSSMSVTCQPEPHPTVILLYPFLFLTLQSISYFKEDLGDIRSSTSMNISGADPGISERGGCTLPK